MHLLSSDGATFFKSTALENLLLFQTDNKNKAAGQAH
jgi:hypothetical protein